MPEKTNMCKYDGEEHRCTSRKAVASMEKSCTYFEEATAYYVGCEYCPPGCNAICFSIEANAEAIADYAVGD